MTDPITGFVFLVGAGPGDPGLMTVRGLQCLRQAQVVVHDRLANPVLHAYAAQAEWVDVGKSPNHHPVPQEQINAILIEKAQAGLRVVRLKGGDPFIFGRGGEEAWALVEAGIPFEVVPGVTSAVAGPAYAGIPVTFRSLACSAAFITGHRADCGPDPSADWRRVAQGADTLVFLMGVQSLPRIVEEMLAAGRPPETPVALVEQATTPRQKTVTGTLENIVERAAAIHPPALIIIGPVVDLREKLRWFDRSQIRPLLGVRVLNTRPAGRRQPVGMESPYIDEFSRRLSELGAEPVELPAARLAPPADPENLDRALHRLANGPQRYDWVVFTSAQAVEFLTERLFHLGYDARIFGAARIAAVGRATSQALRALGLRADFLPSQVDGAGLAQELPDVSGRTLLLPRSDAALPDLVAGLEARQAQVEAVVCYAVQPEPPHPELIAELLAGKLHAAAFFSPSAVRGLADMLDSAGREALAALQVVCIGPTTAEAARLHGLRVDRVAAEPSVEGVCTTLSELFAAEAVGSRKD